MANPNSSQVSIAVTGANGFVGQGLVRLLTTGRWRLVRPLSRTDIGEIGSATVWSDAIKGVECVIHCAARTHVNNEAAVDALRAYRAVNVEGTRRLAEQASLQGVRRLVFVSSIKVNGEQTTGLHRFSAQDQARPEDPYGISKWEAEQALHEVAARTGLEVVVVRPPLVYGPGVKGNLGRLQGLVRRGLPLPLAAVDNRRSLVGLDNLVDLLVCCVEHPSAAGETFLVSDGEDVSTPNLLRHMAGAMGRSARLFPVPVSLLRLGGRVLGRQSEVDRLVGSLQVDISHTREMLGWTPPVSLDEGIRRMVTGS